MNHLFYTSTAIYRSYILLLDEAEILIQKGETPLFLSCDGTLSSYCFTNVTGNRNICKLCRLMRQKGMKALSKPVKNYFIRDLLNPDEINYITNCPLPYNSVDDVLDITYKGVDIGYATISHYCTTTRDFTPTITAPLRKTLDGFLRTAMFLTDAVKSLLSKHSFASASLFNGRTFDTRPFLRLCVAQHIPTRVFELADIRGITKKICFWDSLPQNVEMQGKLIMSYWQQVPASEKPLAYKIGHEFFEKRRTGIRAGDRVFIDKQVSGRLPDNWDSNKKNIVFFGSSEDEFVAIDKTWDSHKFAKTQIDGIRKVLDLIRDEQASHHVYLRIHPNLAGISYAYHTDLYKLEQEYPVLTIIPPTSPISSYSLLDHADKVIVYGSTIGIEGCYWGKPVILIGPAYYQHLDACYIPKNDADLKRLLLTELAPKSQLPAIMYGYSILGNVGTPFEHFDFSLFWLDLFLRKVVRNRETRIKILTPLLPFVQSIIRMIPTVCHKLSLRSLRKAAEKPM
jgi:hypothetical protein